jgi:hypothetical protein
MDDIKIIAPPDLPVPADPWTDDFEAIATWDTVTAAQRLAQAQRLLKAGAEDAYNRVGLQLFVAGLKPTLRSKLMESDPTTLRQAFETAVNFEGLQKEPRRAHASHVAAIEEREFNNEDAVSHSNDEEDDGDETEIAAVTKKLKNLKKKAQKKKKGSASQSSTQAKPKFSNGQNAASAKDGCRFCGNKGHMQRACFKRKAAGAPCVDQAGNPLPGESVSSIENFQQFVQWQQQQLQQQREQQQRTATPFMAPGQQYAHADSIERVGGGAWAHNPYNVTGQGYENVPNGFPLKY